MGVNRNHQNKQRKYEKESSGYDYPRFFANEESGYMNYEGILSNKQHLNLSRNAYSILMDDMLSFRMDSISGYLNLIFHNYYELAESSISRSLDRVRQLEEQLIASGECTEGAMQALLQQESDRLVLKARRYPKGVGLKFYLNKENAEIIENEFAYEAGWYQGHPMRYFKCVIEEYAEKNRLEREEILFRKQIEVINHCIEHTQLICIENAGQVYEVRPYRVIPDYNAMHYYLAGISRPANTGMEEDKIASFRISRIENIRPRPKTYRSGRLTVAEQKQMVERLERDGVQFLISPSLNVKVRLTSRGMERFHNQTHLRPQATSMEETEGGYICEFKCTETQIRYYFFQFGPDVEILEPESLRAVFRENYRKAFSMYEDN